MDEATRTALRQELFDVDQKIAELNEQIQQVRWRHSSEGNRRKSAKPEEWLTDGKPSVALHSASLQMLTDERRVPSTQRISILRRELASALHRYLALQSLLRISKSHSENT